jgi:hypothetical protein
MEVSAISIFCVSSFNFAFVNSYLFFDCGTFNRQIIRPMLAQVAGSSPNASAPITLADVPA